MCFGEAKAKLFATVAVSIDPPLSSNVVLLEEGEEGCAFERETPRDESEPSSPLLLLTAVLVALLLANAEWVALRGFCCSCCCCCCCCMAVAVAVVEVGEVEGEDSPPVGRVFPENTVAVMVGTVKVDTRTGRITHSMVAV